MASVDTEYKRRRRKVWAVGGLAAAALYGGGAYVFDTRIEDDLEKRVPEALADAGIPGVTASFSGQDGTLSCDEPISDPDDAREIALDVHGVNKIDLADSCITNTEPDPVETTEVEPAEEPDAAYATVAQIVDEETDFQQLANLVGASDLATSLDDEASGPYTVFAPTNSAFEAVPADQLNALGPDPELRDKVLGYHVVEGEITADQLANSGELTTLTGETLVIAGQGADVTVGGAAITSGPISADNGLVYGIDQVLVPEGLDLAPEQPPASVGAVFEQGEITLSGVVADEAGRAALVEAAAAQVGAENVTDNLSIDPEAGADADTVGSVATLIDGMGTNLVKGEVGSDENGLYANGQFATDADEEAMLSITDSLDATANLEQRPDADADTAADLETELNEYVAQNPILFEPNSDELSEASITVVDKIATSMQEIANLNIIVEGHTDSDGDAAKNKQLSDARAAAVAQELGERGVPRGNVSAIGYGEEQPVLVNGAEDKAASRRVVFQLEPAS